MPVQKQRKTKARRDRRRVRFTIKPKKLITCPKCAKMMTPHQACVACGFYRGKEIVNTVKKLKTAKNK